MDTTLGTLWSSEQIILSIIMLLGAVALVFCPGRPPQSARHHSSTFRPSRVPLIGLGLILAIVAVFLAGRLDNPVGLRMDSWSDANVIVSGRNYARLGLFANYGVPQHQVVTDTNPPDPFYLYTRYPIAANVISGLWHVAGVSSVSIQRMLPAACSLIAVAIWFLIYSLFIPRAGAAPAAAVLGTSYGFLAYADNLHFHGYALLTTAGAVYAFLRGLAPATTHRARWLVGCGCCMFLGALFTWEYHLWLVVFMLVYCLVFPCPIRRTPLLWLLTPLLAAFAILSLQRSLSMASLRASTATGNFTGFLDDLYRRTIGFGVAADTPEQITLSGYPGLLCVHFFMFYGVPLLGAIAVTIACCLQDRRLGSGPPQLRPETRLLIALLAAGVAWWLVMLQHTSVHPHVLRHALPAYALLLTMTWSRCTSALRHSGTPMAIRALVLVLALSLVYAHFEGAWCNYRLHFDPDFSDDRGRDDAGFNEAPVFRNMAELIPPGAVILTNHNRIPLMRLGTDRPVYKAAMVPYPPNEPEKGRLTLELVFNHLRELHVDKLPPVYCVYTLWYPTFNEAFDQDGLLQLLLIGNEPRTPTQWDQKAHPALTEALDTGRTDKSHCPIVGHVANMLIFRMDPAIPELRRAFADLPPPTLAEFGPGL